MTKTKPDNVADNPALLPYGSNVGAPSILIPNTELILFQKLSINYGLALSLVLQNLWLHGRTSIQIMNI